MITLYQSAYKTTDYVKVLPDLLYNYNHRYNRAIECSPIDGDEKELFTYEHQKYLKAQQRLDLFKIGDKVRVLLNKDLFQKGRSEWSPEVYRISDIVGHRLLVNGKWYQYYQLQRIGAVHTKLFDNNEAVDKEGMRKERKTLRDLRKEGVAENRDTFDGRHFVGRRVRVPKSHFKGYKGPEDYFDGVIESYKKTRGDPKKNYDWKIRYDNGVDETMNYGEIERYMV